MSAQTRPSASHQIDCADFEPILFSSGRTWRSGDQSEGDSLAEEVPASRGEEVVRTTAEEEEEVPSRGVVAGDAAT